jgi:hypothetical protein
MKSKYLNTKKYMCCVCGTERSSILLNIKGTTEMTTSLRKRKKHRSPLNKYYLAGKPFTNLAAETYFQDSFASMMAPCIISFGAAHKQPFLACLTASSSYFFSSDSIAQ